MFHHAEPLARLVARAKVAVGDGEVPTAMLRWERTFDNDGLTPSRRHDIHEGVTRLCGEPNGGLLFVVMPSVDYDGGAFTREAEAAVRAFAGKAVEDYVIGEAQEGRVHVFHLRHADVAPLSAELDATTCPADELDTPDFRRAVRGPAPSPADFGHLIMSDAHRRMLAMNMAIRENVRLIGTIAGVVAFHPQAHQYVPGALVVADAATGAGWRGSMTKVVDIAARWAEQSGFPRGAVAELMSNAWVHRDWSKAVREQPIRLIINGRRLDVVSPGGLGGKGSRRNPVLYQLCRDSGQIRGMGTGVADLAEDLAEVGRCSLDVVEIGGDTRARLTLAAAVNSVPPDRRDQANRRADHHGSVDAARVRDAPPREHATPRRKERAPTKVTTKVSDPPARVEPPPARLAAPPAEPRTSASPRDEELLRFVAARGEVSCKAVQDELAWSRSTTRDVLARLVTAGRLRRTEADPRSPTQAYRLA